MPSQAEIEGQQSDTRQVPPPFSIVARDLDATTCVIAVTGELDLATAPDLSRMLDRTLDAGARVVVDLSDTVFIDSTALSVLLAAGRRLGAEEGAAADLGGTAGQTGGVTGARAGDGADRAGSRLAIVCTRPNVLRIFEFSGLDGAFAIFATLDQALAHARRGRTAPCAG